MKYRLFPAVISLLLVSLACTLTDGVTDTPPPTTGTASPEATMTAPGATSTLEEPALTPDTAKPGTPVIVCFANGYNGQVRVRACGGLECNEIAILPAGTSLVVTETMTNEAGTWARIVFPIEGWVNARYACEVE